MSMVRVVTRIIPDRSSQDSISALLSPSKVGEPLRTTCDSGVGPVRTETTFCRAEPISPDCINVDREVSKACEGINGLIGLKKSRLKVVTETQLATEVTCGFRVTPEIGPDGTCTGMLLSIPLTIPRSEVLQESSTGVGDLNSHVSRGEENNWESSLGTTDQESSFYAKNAVNNEVSQGDLNGTDIPNGDSVLTELTTASERNALKSLKIKACPLRFKKDQFTCDQCGKKFLGKRHLVLHSRRAHSGVPCPLCKALFPSGKHIKDHMGEAHAGQLPHTCPTCGARFLTAETLRDHERQHRKKERRNRCVVCGKGFAHEKLLQSHMAAVHFTDGLC
ncbi:hypothetical protein JTE90_008609 [Oedothorax gibbosus]|uniref:C2H2-type domain-containing protein n=1 Tax=Oedothorax gibbosus TaxID=931172 RepID=A0AAV6UD01_9ARAC|nr:hypothetical protein JTE90_008609 [Oedothorax gibbosus]